MEKNRYSGERNVNFSIVEEFLYRSLNAILAKYFSMDMSLMRKMQKNRGKKMTYLRWISIRNCFLLGIYEMQGHNCPWSVFKVSMLPAYSHHIFLVYH